MKVKKITNEAFENMQNLDDVKSTYAEVNPVMADAMIDHEKKEDNFEKVTKQVDKPFLGRELVNDNQDIEVTGRESDKHNPEEEIMAPDATTVTESLMTESSDNDGWNLEDSVVSEVLDQIQDLKYEIDNCVRGSYATNCKTYADLALVFEDFSDRLAMCAEELENMDEDTEDNEMDEQVENIVRNTLQEAEGKRNNGFTKREKRSDVEKEDDRMRRKSMFDKVYGELEKDRNNPKNVISMKQKYNSEDLAVKYRGDTTLILVQRPSKEDLENAKKVAEYFGLDYKITLGSASNKAHAFQIEIAVPENAE